MTTVKQNEQAIRCCVDLFNKCALEWVEACYVKEAEWIELPIARISTGRQGDRTFLRETAGRILRLYPNRPLRILNLMTQTDQVVLEQEWQGTAVASAGGIIAGTMIRFQVASFFRLVDGLIVNQTDYCIPIPAQGATQ